MKNLIQKLREFSEERDCVADDRLEDFYNRYDDLYSILQRIKQNKPYEPRTETTDSNYPLFIVAPISKKNRVFEQAKRPVFKKLGLDKEVRYLSYEVIDEVDDFFKSSNKGGLL